MYTTIYRVLFPTRSTSSVQVASNKKCLSPNAACLHVTLHICNAFYGALYDPYHCKWRRRSFQMQM